MELSGTFVHHVFFWLKNPDDVGKLQAGLEKLTAVSTIKDWHIGKPASTSREVIDGSYSLSWMITFANKEDQDSYQTDPIHLEFVDTCHDLWTRVVVYDSVNS